MNLIDTDTFIDIMIMTVTLAMAVIPIHNEIQKDKKGEAYKRSDWFYPSIIICAVIIIGFTYWKDIRTANEKELDKITSTKQHSHDSTIMSGMNKRIIGMNDKIDSLGYTYISSSNTLFKKMDSVNGHNKESFINENPIITTFMPQNGRPAATVIPTSKKDTFNFEIFTQNIANGIAKNLNSHVAAIQRIDSSHYSISSNSSNVYNESIIMDKNKAFLVEKQLSNYFYPDTAYIYIKITYTNYENEPQAPFRRIYILTPDFIGKQLPEVNQSQYKFLKDYLKKNKVW